MKTEKIHYQKEENTGFYNTLRKRVNEALINYEKRTSYIPAAKTILLLLLYLTAIILGFIAIILTDQ